MKTYNQFLLLKLAEECAEVGHRAMKQIQFGKDETQMGQDLTNARRLRDELNDLFTVVALLELKGEIPSVTNEELMEAGNKKTAKLAKYYAYSKMLGNVA